VVHVAYSFVPMRLDTIAALADGSLRVFAGKPGAGAILPPDLPQGAVALANIWHHGPAQKLTEDDLYPIEPQTPAEKPTPSVAEQQLPRTLAKLRAGQEVRIVAWGDSVTAGGGVGGNGDLWYQNVFAKELRERFPQAKITMLTAAWGGRDSATYMASPRGSEKDFVRDVIEPHPDLVTIEFVNDAGLKDQALVDHYNEIMKRLAEATPEVILIAPHLVRPDWMGLSTYKFDEDPRPYVKGLKAYAEQHNLALADVSTLWCRLWRQGLPYMTLEANSINHPDARGHQLFADALMALFPDK
jgi:lysophospholipase L1-like esterase